MMSAKDKKLRFTKIYQKCKKMVNRNLPGRKNFKKTIDKSLNICYNIYTVKERN